MGGAVAGLERPEQQDVPIAAKDVNTQPQSVRNLVSAGDSSVRSPQVRICRVLAGREIRDTVDDRVRTSQRDVGIITSSDNILQLERAGLRAVSAPQLPAMVEVVGCEENLVAECQETDGIRRAAGIDVADEGAVALCSISDAQFPA